MVCSSNGAKLLRVGIIGTGDFVEACHIPELKAHPRVEIVALCGRDLQRTRLLATRHGIAEAMTDYHQLCARPDVDAITIASRNIDHVSHAIAALHGRKHVFCEKPLATTVADAKRMASLAGEIPGIHQVAFTYRYLYGVRRLRQLVRQGEIGVPHYIRLQYDTWQGLEQGFQIGFRDKMELAGGGVLFDVGSHLIDLAAHLFGPIDQIAGLTVSVPRHALDSRSGETLQVETDDMATALLTFKNGVRGQISISRVSPSVGSKSWVEVIGERGALRALLSRGSVDVLQRSQPSRPTWEEVSLPDAASDGKPHCLGLMMRSFVEACCRGELDLEVDASFQDGLLAQEAMAAVELSGRRQEWVGLGRSEGVEIVGQKALKM
ncbi:MAG: Gfo/Idh/MocA family oxidoreductase [Nitrospiraceae bacterium]